LLAPFVQLPVVDDEQKNSMEQMSTTVRGSADSFPGNPAVMEPEAL
jgi:hypothetical protein